MSSVTNTALGQHPLPPRPRTRPGPPPPGGPVLHILPTHPPWEPSCSQSLCAGFLMGGSKEPRLQHPFRSEAGLGNLARALACMRPSFGELAFPMALPLTHSDWLHPPPNTS